MFFSFPKRGSRNGYGYQPESDNKEIHGKTAPNYQAGFLESPYFGDTIINNIRNWENQQSCSHGQTTNLDYFCLKKIRRNKAYIK